MPFDVMLETPLARRQRLVSVLRGKLPENHTWYFATVLEPNTDTMGHSCGTVGCAMGVAILLWPEIPHKKPNGGRVQVNEVALGKFLDMTEDEIERIFFISGYEEKNPFLVTPEMVAEKLELIGTE